MWLVCYICSDGRYLFEAAFSSERLARGYREEGVVYDTPETKTVVVWWP